MDYRKTTLLLFCFFFFVLGCKKQECEETIDQVYVYPLEAANGKPSDERIQMFKIPEQILHCLSTEALVKSCLDYPEFGLVWAYNTLKQGFDQVSSRCNGFDELWKRGDKFQVIYSLYQQKNPDRGNWDSYTDLENGQYLFDIIQIELIISQYEVLHELSVSEKTELFQLVLDNQKKKVDLIKYWGVIGMETTIAILGRIMYRDNYQPMVEEYNNNEYMFFATTYVFIKDYDIVNKIMSLSVDYLTILKNKQK
jgi:hypothetical protein